ncbi:TPA: HNH endonuclease [Klebsiella variicola subsp. variicola]|uniref:HNH endonuclease n=1 Tax=Klebsiella variicola TaxID=244366 RepID=UPI00254E59EF|nr:hypothetical protein [Klebsiella variicola]MEC5673644.1 hypothetical protein [Klebsiella variicola]
MNKITYPNINCDDLFSTCLLSVSNGNQDYKNRMESIAENISTQWRCFDDRIAPKSLHEFSPCQPRRVNQIIAGEVTKKDLKDLYTVYMLKINSDARKVYDKLRASAKGGLCPLCGIYGVETLDHYLPKARYPLFSVHPKNLVPACEHCNGAKSDDILKVASDQTLYPYHDDIKFYNTDWIKASITAQHGILVFDFHVAPPLQWLEVERKRVINHFTKFELRQKYVRNSSQFVSTITADIRRILLNGDYIAVKNHYAELVSAVKFNSTLRAMYHALSINDDICSGRF